MRSHMLTSLLLGVVLILSACGNLFGESESPPAEDTQTPVAVESPVTNNAQDAQGSAETKAPATDDAQAAAETELPIATTEPSADSGANADPTNQTIRMARATWNTGWFQAEIYAQLLAELGYVVEGPQTLENDAFYTAVAAGEAELWVNGWFPLHNGFIEEQENQVERLGSQMRGGALQGYLIDKATADEFGITNLADLSDPDTAALFDKDGDGKADLIGCNEGWGCAEIINYQLPEFNLTDNIEHIQDEYNDLMLEALESFEAGEPILFYTWTPNWPLAELTPGEDVVWLEVPFSALPADQASDPELTVVPDVAGCVANPCNMGFVPSDIRVVGNASFLSTHPTIRRLLELVEIPLDDVTAQNATMFFGEDSEEDIERQAQDWIADNRAQVDQWLAEARTWEASSTLERVQARGSLLCGTQENIPGFGFRSGNSFEGFNADMCRAVAAAVLGDPTAVTFVPLTTKDRFAAVQDRKVDVLFHNTSWSALRDLGMNPPNSGIRLAFGPTIFHDGQRFLVPIDANISRLDDLAGREICVLAGSSAEQTLNDQFAARGIDFTLVRIDTVEELYGLYERGGCDAVTSDTSELAGRQSTFVNPDEHTILPAQISREPHSPVYGEGDMEWADIVNWVVFATIYAEELQVNSTNVDEQLTAGDPDIDRLLGVRGNIGQRLGLANDFALTIVREVGNYREIYLRNIDPAILPRGPNKTWNSPEGPGGLLSSPPFR